MKHTCIYCKEEKEESEFNREHVVPRMMGRYTDKIGLDSYEALLRMMSGIKKMKDGHRVRNNRLAITGAEGIFNGLRFIPISDSNSPERVSFEIVPCVSFQKNDEEYDYFSIDEIPDATEEVMQRLKKYKSPIIQFGYEREQIDTVLREKGYLNEKSP